MQESELVLARSERHRLGDTTEFALERLGLAEPFAPHDLDRAPDAGDAPRQPDLAIASLSDLPQQIVVGDFWRRGGGHRVQRANPGANLGITRRR
jgi:hypothetical protein